MKSIRAIALAGLIGISGCTGFAAGLKHATVGYEATPAERMSPGYDLTVAITNALIALGGYALRHYQEKIMPKGKNGLPK